MGSERRFGYYSLGPHLAAAMATTASTYSSLSGPDPAYEAEKKRLAALKDTKRAVLGPKRSRWST